MAAGRNAKGEPLLDDKTISHSILDDALKSNSEFVLTDTSRSLDLSGRQSIVAYDLRTVICVPLRKPQVQTSREALESPCIVRRSNGRALCGFPFRLERHLDSEQRYSSRDRHRSRIADRKCTAGASGGNVAPLPTGTFDCGIHSTALDGRHHSRGSVRAHGGVGTSPAKKSAAIFLTP